MSGPVEVVEGAAPLVLAMPHTGTAVSDEIAGRLNATGLALADTDWHVHQLYAGLLPGATTVRATFHRYVIDANRDPSGSSLYPGQNTTGLCPTTDFDGQAIYRPGQEPGAEEVEARRRAYHAPYHQALAEQLERARARHGLAVLYDCHSIRSQVPFLFAGDLPDFNIGTNDGVTCHLDLQDAVVDICELADGYSAVLNGRFKGGWTTRHYGDPRQHRHAIQMELAQKTYMDEAAPWTYRPQKAETLRQHLKSILQTLNDLALSGALAA